MLVYDISNRNSFEIIKEYYCPKIKELCKKNIPIILLGNKADLEDKREVTIEEGAGLALEGNFKFKETSCQKNENVADAFEALIELWNFENHKKYDRRKSEDISKLSEEFEKIFTPGRESIYKPRNSVCLDYIYNTDEEFNFEEDINDQRLTIGPNNTEVTDEGIDVEKDDKNCHIF